MSAPGNADAALDPKWSRTPSSVLSRTWAPAESLDSEPLIGLAWIWRLRWAALVGQIAALAVARIALGMQPDWAKLAAAGLLFFGSNIALGRWLAHGKASHRLIGAVLLFDSLLLTVLLLWSGGAANPFSAFYVVHVAIAALMLGPLWALGFVVLTSLCFGALFLVPAQQHGAHVLHVASNLHLQGMWAAYVFAAGFVAYFVSRVAAALRAREQQMELLQRRMAGMQRVAALSTMAAGAAHELGSPLSTIAVAARELSNALSQDEKWAPFADEALQIREEVSRCRGILDRLAMGSGHPAGEAPAWLRADEIGALVREELGATDADAVQIDATALSQHRIQCPPRALGHALKNLVKNGIDANRANRVRKPVVLRLLEQAGRAVFEVSDHGARIPPELCPRLGEPFFTTKSPGAGMGLGLYLVSTFAQQVGGELRFGDAPGAGALVILSLREGSIELERDPA